MEVFKQYLFFSIKYPKKCARGVVFNKLTASSRQKKGQSISNRVGDIRFEIISLNKMPPKNRKDSCTKIGKGKEKRDRRKTFAQTDLFAMSEQATETIKRAEKEKREADKKGSLNLNETLSF